jgi:hypothetical protein
LPQHRRNVAGTPALGLRLAPPLTAAHHVTLCHVVLCRVTATRRHLQQANGRYSH